MDNDKHDVGTPAGPPPGAGALNATDYPGLPPPEGELIGNPIVTSNDALAPTAEAAADPRVGSADAAPTNDEAKRIPPVSYSAHLRAAKDAAEARARAPIGAAAQQRRTTPPPMPQRSPERSPAPAIPTSATRGAPAMPVAASPLQDDDISAVIAAERTVELAKARSELEEQSARMHAKLRVVADACESCHVSGCRCERRRASGGARLRRRVLCVWWRSTR